MPNGPGNLQALTQQLQRATRSLQETWGETRQSWTDTTADDFERLYLDPILPSLRLVLAAATEMEELYRQVARDLR